MATRFFLRDTAAANPPTAGEKSTILPAGTFTGNAGTGFEDRSLHTTAGPTGGVIKQLAALAQTAHQDGYIARFTSGALAAQTIAANTWTLRLARFESNATANAFTVCSVYVWRPSTSAVVGFIYDSDAVLGTEWPTSGAAAVVSLAGSAVVAAANDVLVLECWVHAAQGMASSFVRRIMFDGADGTTRGSYLETPQNFSIVLSPTRGRVSWTEFSAPIVPTRGLVSWAEFEAIHLPTVPAVGLGFRRPDRRR